MTEHRTKPGDSLPGARKRYAILRDIDSPVFSPLAVVFETDSGGAEIEFFENAPASVSRLRREYKSFDDCLVSWGRSALLSALGTERKHP